MFEENMKLTGRLQIALNGEVVQNVDNLVVTVGKNFVASRMKDATATAMSHMGIGSGSSSAAAGDTALGNQLDRNALTSTTVTNNEVVYSATFAAGEGTGAVTEAGIFNAATSGTLLCRTVFSTVNKGAADSLSIQWSVTVS
jgi:hypothetical protein